MRTICFALFAVTIRLFAAEEAPKAAALPIAELRRDNAVDFEKEILPLLKNNCLACHNQTKAKAELVLETPQTILKGGENGPAVIPGKSAESLLLKAAAHIEKPFMPPKDNKVNAADFTAAQLGLLKLWIDQGARGEVHGVAPIAWLDQPPALDPIFALALTADGQFAAAGRGNRIDIYHVPSGRFLTRLTDPQRGFTNAAHRDLVNALAFHPAGTQLASAGFREVKLWNRPRNVQKSSFLLGESAALLAISPDHRWLAAAETNHLIALIDLATGQAARTFAGHSNTPVALRFSADSVRIASVDADRIVCVWTVADASLLASGELPGTANALAWLPGDKRLAAGGEDGQIGLFEIPAVDSGSPTAAWKPVQELKGHTAAITALEPLPGTNGLLSASADGTLRQWDLAEAKSIREFKHEAPVTALAVRPDGKRFASAGTNRIVRLWNIEDGRPVSELKGDRYANELVAETGRSLTVATGDVDYRKKTLETAEGESKKQGERVVKAGDTNAATEKILAEKKKAFDEAAAAKEKSAKDLAALITDIQKITGEFEAAALAATNATTIAKATASRAAESKLAAERAGFAKADTEKIAADAAAVAEKTKSSAANELPPEARAAAQKVAEDAAGVAQKARSLAEVVAAGAEAKKKLAVEAVAAAEKAIEEVAALSFNSGRLKPAYDKTLAEAPEKRKTATNQLESATKALASAETEFKKAETRKSVTGHELELAQQAAQRASNIVTTARVELADAEGARKKVETELDVRKTAAAAAQQPVRALAFSSDNRTLATGGDDQAIHTWNADTGAPFEVLRGHTGTIGALTFTDGSTLVSVAGDRREMVWDLNPPWTLERVIGTGDVDSPLVDRVNAVDFSPDGRVLATASGEPTRGSEVKLWSAADGKLLTAFTNIHSDAVLSLRFSPDGRFLASSSADRFVRVVELATGRVVKAFEGHTSYVLGVAWKRDSRTLASAGADKVIKMWDFVTGERKKNIEGAEKEVTAIAFVGATGDAVAASGDSQVRLVRENGDKVRSFEGASEFMNTVAVTPDGQIVVAGGQDGMMYVWNGGTGEKLATFGPAR